MEHGPIGFVLIEDPVIVNLGTDKENITCVTCADERVMPSNHAGETKTKKERVMSLLPREACLTQARQETAKMEPLLETVGAKHRKAKFLPRRGHRCLNAAFTATTNTTKARRGLDVDCYKTMLVWGTPKDETSQKMHKSVVDGEGANWRRRRASAINWCYLQRQGTTSAEKLKPQPLRVL